MSPQRGGSMARPTKEDYEKMIRDLQDGMSQLEPDGKGCAVCGDSDHQAWECHHNPLILVMEARKDKATWRCFHCDAVFTSHDDAAKHFGAYMTRNPACVVDVGEVLGLADTILLDAQELPASGQRDQIIESVEEIRRMCEEVISHMPEDEGGGRPDDDEPMTHEYFSELVALVRQGAD